MSGSRGDSHGAASSAGSAPLRLTRIIATAEDDAVADRLHALEHDGRLETVTLGRDDLARRRIRTRTDAGTDCAIAIDRAERLFDGAVLLLEEDRAVVIRMEPERWLVVRASDPAAALRLGYFAGNMHWRVRFEGDALAIALEGRREAYVQRLAPVIDAGGVEVAEP